MAKAKEEYTVVARRYRPQQFDDLIGQEHVAQALRNALASGRVAHAYLFTGARGVGKTSTARILAKALNCAKGPTATPCDKCSSCVAIATGDDIDVREIDGASNRQIDDIRAIRAEVNTRPTRGRYKIYIIDEVHMLTMPAFNAVLKTLEEPPAHVKFIFATTEVQKVPITILSRCQRFDFGVIHADRIVTQLRSIVKDEKAKADEEALEMIARRAAGSMRDAQSLLDQLLAFGGDKLTAETVQSLLGVAGPERVLALAQAVFSQDAKATLEQLDSLADNGLQLGELLDQLIEYWRDLMLLSCAGKEAPGLSTPARQRETLLKQAGSVSLDTILTGLDILIQAKTKTRGSGQLRTLMQMALLRLCRLEDLVAITQVAAWLQQSPVGDRPATTLARPATGLAPPTEAKKKVELAAGEPAATPSGPKTIETIWPQFLAEIGGVLSSQLQRKSGVAIAAPNTLVVSFAPEYNSAYEHCSNPVNKQRLDAALQKLAGQAWSVRLETMAGVSTSPAPNTPPPTPAMGRRARFQEAVQKVPVLKRAEEKLGAMVIDLDEDFGAAAPTPATQPAAEEFEPED